MELPYELQGILRPDKNGFCIIEPTIVKYLNNLDKYVLSQVINSLGESSNMFRHLYRKIIII